MTVHVLPPRLPSSVPLLRGHHSPASEPEQSTRRRAWPREVRAPLHVCSARCQGDARFLGGGTSTPGPRERPPSCIMHHGLHTSRDVQVVRRLSLHVTSHPPASSTCKEGMSEWTCTSQGLRCNVSAAPFRIGKVHLRSLSVRILSAGATGICSRSLRVGSSGTRVVPTPSPALRRIILLRPGVQRACAYSRWRHLAIAP